MKKYFWKTMFMWFSLNSVAVIKLFLQKSILGREDLIYFSVYAYMLFAGTYYSTHVEVRKACEVGSFLPNIHGSFES